MLGMWPGVIREVDRERRQIRVSIEGLTDGAEKLLLAETLSALGDKSENTEIRLLPNDRVWLAFREGDTRFPIIMGYRNKNVGNEVGTRRLAHDNFETTADENFDVISGSRIRLKVGDTVAELTPDSVTITTTTLNVTADSTFNGPVTVNGNVRVVGEMVVTGLVTARDFLAGIIRLLTHKHPTAPSGPPSPPIP